MQCGRDMLTKRVKPIEAKTAFMRRDLKNTVGGGVANGLPRLQMRLTELVDDCGPGRMTIAQNAVRVTKRRHRFG